MHETRFRAQPGSELRRVFLAFFVTILVLMLPCVVYTVAGVRWYCHILIRRVRVWWQERLCLTRLADSQLLVLLIKNRRATARSC